MTPRRIVISGASRGIGEALARAYAGPGVSLVLLARDAVRLAEVARICRQAGAAVDEIVADIRDRDTVRSALSGADAAGAVDLVIANAGVALESGGLADVERASYGEIEVNLVGALNTVLPLVPAMVARRRGQIALMSSLAAYAPLADAPGYSASEGGATLLWHRAARAPPGERRPGQRRLPGLRGDRHGCALPGMAAARDVGRAGGGADQGGPRPRRAGNRVPAPPRGARAARRHRAGRGAARRPHGFPLRDRERAGGPRMKGATSVLRTVRDRLLPLPSGAANHIALGTFCHSASALRAVGLRRWTGPLDWIFSTPGMIAECLGDGFRTLIDPAHFQSVPAAELMKGTDRQCRHLYYEDRYRLPTLFNHHDPARSPADLASLSRAVVRLNDALAGARTNILYMVSEVPWPEPEIAEVLRVLGGFPARNVLVIVTAAQISGERNWKRAEVLPPEVLPPGALPPGALPVEATRVDVAVDVASRSFGIRFHDAQDDALLADALLDTAAFLDPTIKRRN